MPSPAGRPAFRSVAPVIPVRDLTAALDRYALLGFEVRRYDGPDAYGFADRDDVSLHLSEWAEHDPARTGAVVYLYVEDADAVHREWASLGLPGRLTTPADAPYGLREFAFVDIEGTLHRVGSWLRDETSINEGSPAAPPVGS